jgi:ATP-dependent Zn protease
MERIADALIAKETLSREEIDKLLAQSSQPQVAGVV